MKKRLLFSYLAVLLTAVLASLAVAGPVSDQLAGHCMYGINRDSAGLLRYDFATGQTTAVGTVATSGGDALTGIDAAAYFPGFRNIFAFWANPADGKNKLVHVDITSGAASIVAEDLEGGRFTGAAAHRTDTRPWSVFAVQAAKVRPPSAIAGLININPNNSPHNEFSVTRADGGVFTRDDLHAASNLPTDGTYYRGDATFIHVKPKGNGNQNGLTINGQAYVLQNSNTYDFSGQMTIRVFNDQVNGKGKAMGKWWIQIVAGQVYVNGEVAVLFPNRIVKVDQTNGTVNEIMPLSRPYAGLATSDGATFLAFADNKDLYRIDTVNLTETKVDSTTLGKVSSIGLIGTFLAAYDIRNSVLGGVNPADAQIPETPQNYGLGPLGVILFAPATLDPVALQGGFD